ncbi:MAG TPA: hypothetical protein GX747_03920, partial [Tenericutes bacterium]|nr:hypothetical protein [Mycoplasmatota bacterium]
MLKRTVKIFGYVTIFYIMSMFTMNVNAQTHTCKYDTLDLYGKPHNSSLYIEFQYNESEYNPISGTMRCGKNKTACGYAGMPYKSLENGCKPEIYSVTINGQTSFSYDGEKLKTTKGVGGYNTSQLIYATDRKVKVTFDYGDQIVETEEIIFGEIPAKPREVKKDQFYFAAWRYEEDNTKVYYFDRPILKDTKFIAQYESLIISSPGANGPNVSCGSITDIPKQLPKLFSIFIDLIKIVVPIGIVIKSMIDISKAVMSQKEDEMKKGTQMFI